MKKYSNYLLAFLLPIGIMLFVMLISKIYPFGDKILLMQDGYTQHPGFLNSFINSIITGKSFLYSFKGLIGFNLYACFAYYTFNISNLLFLLFKTNNIIDFYTFIIILKIGLASLSMCIFLSYFNKDKKIIIFSLCYGLSSYNLLYYLNYMWFDSVILLPIVIMGIEKIFKENNYYIYTIFLSLVIISNFYIGYMICIFSVIYFTYKSIINKPKKIVIIKYILYSILAGLISCFAMLPVILELLQGKANLIGNYTNSYFKFDLDFISIFYKLTLGSYSNGDLEYGGPNVYTSILVFINVMLLFFNKNISLKEKVLSFGIILIFVISMSFNLLDYFWHMMQMPIWYPVRYAFIFDFYLIYLAFKNYISYQKLNIKENIIVFSLMLVLIISGFFTSGNLIDKVNILPKTIYLGISILFIVYYFCFSNNNYLKRYIWIILLIELSINTFIVFRNNGNANTYSEFINNYNDNQEIVNSLRLNNFERLSFEKRTIKNNGLLHNYNDLNLFTSVRNQKSYYYLKNVMGILTIDDCNTNYYFNNPIANVLLNIKYYITKYDLNYYSKISTINDYNIYLNSDAMDFGFIMDDAILDLSITDNYLDNINNLVKIINKNEKNIIKKIDPVEKNVNCSENICITNGDNSYIKFYYKSTIHSFIYIQNYYKTSKDNTNYKLEINGKEINFNGKYPIEIFKDDVINLLVEPFGDFKDYLYQVFVVDYSEYEKLINNIKNNSFEIKKYINDAHFIGNINMDYDGILFTGIPNDKGWSIYVDNKKENITPLIDDSIIGLKLKKGNHVIEFKYFPPGLNIGIIISFSSLVLVLLLFILNKRKN